ncbi:sensor histidine kinase [Paenibacillus whitsoniae]|uniref:Signal transduction histidine-protein kinase ArlS n=1 Tax=Paenibacillus whitsoniae TaxID=2496558 RepID=A0A3S0BY79_9BACL|nr:HAMP domain-containing histidine kinase [Paenibacillus whitsoniae]RTE10957.1 HAMP domain-containing histidine kinase [Paenibacillus whitsoniae]
MKIKTKAALLLFVWLIAILLPIIFVIYHFYARFEKEEEMENLQAAANEIVQNIHPSDLLNKNNSSLVLSNYLSNHTMIRVLDKTSTVRNQVSDRFELMDIPPKYSEIKEFYFDTYLQQKILIVRTPIRNGTEIIGTLEVISEPIELEQSLYHLFIIIGYVAFGAILISISGSFLLSRLLFLPLSRMIKIMKEIETSVEFRKLPLNRKSKDELYELSDTFNHMMERIESSVQKQRQFISDASHEFKTSLTIIEGYTSLLQRWGLENIDLQREAIDAVHKESIRMRQVTYQMLELAELEQEAKLLISGFDLVSLCKETIQLLQPLSSKKIFLYPSVQPIQIEADRFQIKQVLLIILDNALKYANQSINIQLENLDPHLCIHIIDDGKGIPTEELPFVFERFYRVDRSRNRQTGGSGLGLAIAKSIVTLHNGNIQINSEQNKGTVVNISLPMRKPFNFNES